MFLKVTKTCRTFPFCIFDLVLTIVTSNCITRVLNNNKDHIFSTLSGTMNTSLINLPFVLLLQNPNNVTMFINKVDIVCVFKHREKTVKPICVVLCLNET